MTLTRRTFLVASAALAALPGHAAGVQTDGGPAFGSYWRLTTPDSVDTAPALRAIARVVGEVDARMSPHRADTDISRFNRLETTDPVRVSPETAVVAQQALAIASDTGGAFDPAVGPIVARYGFGPIGGALGRHVELSASEDSLRKARPGLSLDLCGIAKGHALDRIVADLDGLGLNDFVIELGGEVFARGLHPAGRNWQIAVDAPLHGPTVLALHDMAVATSGNLYQSAQIGTHSFGHLIDPRSGGPAGKTLASVSVFDRSALRADAMATALFVMGRDQAERFAEARGLDALLLGPDGRAVTTGHAARYLAGGTMP